MFKGKMKVIECSINSREKIHANVLKYIFFLIKKTMKLLVRFFQTNQRAGYLSLACMTNHYLKN